MAETAFPILNQPLSDQQWGQVTQGFGSGVLSNGGDPYGITSKDNANNQVTLGLGADGYAKAQVYGFNHRLDAAQTVPIPAVTAATTYRIGLLFDPVKSATTPVTLTVATSIPSGGGKVFLPLWQIVRQPNQLLADATFTDQRVYISPTLTAASRASLPPVAGLLTGTLCTTTDTGTTWRVQEGAWVPANAPWIVTPATSSGWSFDMFTGGIEVRYRTDGKRLASAPCVYMRRTATGTFTQGSTFMGHGFFIPEDLRKGGDFDLFVPGFLQNAAGVHTGTVRIHLSQGALSFRLGSGSQQISQGDAIMFSAAWSTW